MSIYILNIETSTKACSVAIHKNGNLIALKESITENFSHSEKLLVFVEELIETSQIKLVDISAIAVSMGPGSYTGLRIGVATAKGLCYGLNIPLISISTLKSMSLGMSLLMSGVVVAVNTRLTDAFFGRWFYSWMFAFPVALLAAIIIAPMIRSLIDKITIE